MKTYYSLLDPLRFFAAFWVMNLHYLLLLELNNDLHWYRYGNLGVQLFFIISGFVIVQTLKGKTLREFATGRFIRLFPLFWVLCTFTYLLTLAVHQPYHLAFTEYLRSMSMLGDVFNGIIGPGQLVDPSYWTLTVELLFYISIGLFTFLFSYRNIRYFLATWLALSAGAFLLYIDKDFYVKLLLVSHASYFIFGAALALLATKEAKNGYEKYFDGALLVVSAVYSIYIHTRALPLYVTPNPHDQMIVSILLAVFFIGIPLLVYLSPKIKNSRLIHVFAILGGLTYPLYLLHQKIGNIVINYLATRYTISWDYVAVFFEVVILFVAYLVYVQDGKLRKWLREKLVA